jgi:hypothetical protein
MKFENRPKELDYFDLAKGQTIRVYTKLVDNQIHYCYQGILQKKGKDFVYLREGKLLKIENNKETEIKSFQKIALSKAIISWIEF